MVEEIGGVEENIAHTIIPLSPASVNKTLHLVTIFFTGNRRIHSESPATFNHDGLKNVAYWTE